AKPELPAPVDESALQLRIHRKRRGAEYHRFHHQHTNPTTQRAPKLNGSGTFFSRAAKPIQAAYLSSPRSAQARERK
ncbi:hypothetical protein HPB47_010073, partial [Ixodes persulcatus]